MASTPTEGPGRLIRRQLVVTGVVQGVGFRPHVVRMASRQTLTGQALTGLCGNDDNSVFIEVQGTAGAVEAFTQALVEQRPPLSSILSLTSSDIAIQPDESGFRIVASRRAAGVLTLIPADGAICPDCLADMADPANRRYNYPFTSCTNCGPRLSIIRDVPYDRPLTTMAEFPMCPACRREYEDPTDRRYHAQPISCFDCGPDLWLEFSGEATVSGRQSELSSTATPEGRDRSHPPSSADRRTRFAAVISQAREMLRAGKILAVKGIGGFTLMCDARNAEAVASLRQRKHRPGKPFAVMAASLEAARTIADLGPSQCAALAGREAPIVLAPMAQTYDLAPGVAPGLDDVGVMLAYAPVHRLLLGQGDILVATSANASAKPLTYRNADARRDLSGIVDACLMHNRGIHVPVEDSVVMAEGDQIQPIRRSRGYAPLPVFLGEKDTCVLAVGAELKNTFALTRDGMAFLSAHIGDMGSLETQQAYEKSVDQMLTAHRRTPELIVVDKHPGYATHTWGKRYAERLGIPVLEVQHHHAHALSLLAESGRHTPFSCVVLDGTGYGDDGAIWGGEILRLGEDPLGFDRLAHLPEYPLPGGDSAVRQPWKPALGLLWEYGIDPAEVRAWQGATAPGNEEIQGRPSVSADWGNSAPGEEEINLVRSQLRAGLNVARTTSTGRLFDAVASILGLRHQVSYEAQAAMELEACARRCSHDHHAVISSVPDLLSFLIEGVAAGRPIACLARTFHLAVAGILAHLLHDCDPSSSVVGLTGGVFANRLLSADLTAALERQGRRVVRHQIVPANDGGLALGQALAGYMRAQSS